MSTARYHYSNGKRKTAIARVRLFDGGQGKIMINNRPAEEYFQNVHLNNLYLPLDISNFQKKFDINLVVKGGGFAAQSDACRHAIVKAILEFDPTLRLPLKQAGLLTRDARVKERKKPGLKRARRAPQWAKR